MDEDEVEEVDGDGQEGDERPYTPPPAAALLNMRGREVCSLPFLVFRLGMGADQCSL